MARLRAARVSLRPPKQGRQGRAAAAIIDQKSSHGVAQPNHQMETVTDVEMDRDYNSFTVSFNHDDEILGKELRQTWPIVQLRLAFLKVSATLKLNEGSMTVSKISTRKAQSSDFAEAVSVVRLLAIGVPSSKAIKVIRSKQFHAEIIEIGFQKDGLCSRFGVTEKQFLRRRREGLDATQLRAIYEFTGCELFVRGDTVAAIGPSPAILGVVRWAVEGCIVRKLLPSHRLKRFFRSVRLNRQIKKLTALRI